MVAATVGETGMDAWAAFDQFYAANATRLTGQLYTMTGDLAEAQDCVQEAFARAWLRWRTVADHPDPAAWVRVTASRLAVSRFRRAWRALHLAGRAELPTSVPEPSVETVRVTRALRTLPLKQRRALVLHYLLDMPVDAVAAEVGAPVGTVKARLSRGRTALARELGTDEEALDA